MSRQAPRISLRNVVQILSRLEWERAGKAIIQVVQLRGWSWVVKLYGVYISAFHTRCYRFAVNHLRTFLKIPVFNFPSTP